MSGSSLRTLMARLPPEIVELVVLFGGVELCSALRDLGALRRVLTAYVQSGNRCSAYEDTVVKVLVGGRWSAGVQMLLDLDFGGVLRQRDLDWSGIVLSPSAIRKLAEGHCHVGDVAVALIYNRVTAGLGVGDLSSWSDNFCHQLCERLIKGGGDVDRLRSLCQELGCYVDEPHFACAFMLFAARHARMDLVRHLDRIAPELLQEDPSALIEAAGAGSMEMVQYIHERALFENFRMAVRMAAQAGHEQVAEWLYDRSSPKNHWRNVATLARKGHLSLLKRVLAQETTQVIDAAFVHQCVQSVVADNHLEVLQWLYDLDNSFCTTEWLPIYPYDDSLSAVSLSTVQWIVQHAADQPTGDLLCSAATLGRQDLVEWIYEELPGCRTEIAIAHAAGAGHFELARWLADKLGVPLSSCRPEPGHMSSVLCDGRIDVLKWLAQHCDLHVTDDVMSYAIMSHSLAVIQMLHERAPDVPFTERMLTCACDGGNLPLAQFVYQRLPHTSRPAAAMDAAAEFGHLGLLAWLHAHTDLPCSTAAMDRAAGAGRLAVVRFLHEERTEGCTTAAMDAAAAGGFTDVLSYLHQHRTAECTPDALRAAITHNHVHTARWLVAHFPAHVTGGAVRHAAELGRTALLRLFAAVPDAPFSAGVMDTAAAHGHLGAVRLLHAERSEGCSADAMAAALRKGHLAVAKFLYVHGYPVCSRKTLWNAPKYALAWHATLPQP
ncbi:hypothetical protein RI367_008629 [Sorochytrium milnesiophthora]